jgi:hypothetical protein
VYTHGRVFGIEELTGVHLIDEFVETASKEKTYQAIDQSEKIVVGQF